MVGDIPSISMYFNFNWGLTVETWEAVFQNDLRILKVFNQKQTNKSITGAKKSKRSRGERKRKVIGEGVLGSLLLDLYTVV